MTGRRHEYAGGPGARYALLGSSLFLTVFGLVMIYSASSITAAVEEGSSYNYLIRQAVAIVISVLVAWLIARYDYRTLRGRKSLNVWGLTTALLVLPVLIGVARGGAKRWIDLGVMNLQPSELAKLACVLVVAGLAVDWSRRKLTEKQFLVWTAAAVAVPAVLIIVGRDLGTTITLAVGVAAVLFLAGIAWYYLAGVAGLGIGVFVIMILVEPYRMKRISGYLDPWSDPLGKGYHVIQSMLAFGTGGVDGVGLGLSRQKFFYLPEAHTDFILAIIGEEAGLIGTLAVLIAFAVLVWAGLRISLGSRDHYGRLVAGSVTVMLGFQAFLNMGAVTGLLPVTGKPLPFVSYGGSSILATMVAVGLLLSVSQFGALAPRALSNRKRNEGSTRESTHERGRDGRSRPSGAERRRPARRRA